MEQLYPRETSQITPSPGRVPQLSGRASAAIKVITMQEKYIDNGLDGESLWVFALHGFKTAPPFQSEEYLAFQMENDPSTASLLQFFITLLTLVILRPWQSCVRMFLFLALMNPLVPISRGMLRHLKPFPWMVVVSSLYLSAFLDVAASPAFYYHLPILLFSYCIFRSLWACYFRSLRFAGEYIIRMYTLHTNVLCGC